MTEVLPTYHIIGGGLSGLMCAKFLKMHNPKVKVALYEASSQIGGKLSSYYYPPWMMNLDNATHMILSSQKIMRQFVHDDEWHKSVLFAQMPEVNLSVSPEENQEVLLKSLCRGSIENISPKLRNSLQRFYFSSKKTMPKFYTTCGNLNTRIVNLLAPFADVITYDCELKKMQVMKGRVYGLLFNQGRIKLGKNDRVILALDNAETSALLALPKLQSTSSLSVNYYTSQTIFFPHGASFIGLQGGIADWIVVNPNLITAFIYDYCQEFSTYDKLALKIWSEIAQIRGVNSGFTPSYKVNVFTDTGIKIDDANNALRPDNALSKYDNVFICGDWTMKDYPCCMETAALSAQRAVRAAYKAKLK